MGGKLLSNMDANETVPKFFLLQLINTEVAPTHAELNMGAKRVEEAKRTHEKRLQRRRNAYKRKHGREPTSDADLSLDKTFTDDEGDEFSPDKSQRRNTSNSGADDEGVEDDPLVDVEQVDAIQPATVSHSVVVPDPEHVVIDLSLPREEIMKQLFGSDKGGTSSSSNETNVMNIEVPVSEGQLPPEFQVIAEGSGQVIILIIWLTGHFSI